MLIYVILHIYTVEDNMNYINKDYKSESFKNRIEVSLANVSVSPNDEFRLIKTSYQPFNCELCGHVGCVYQFTIENLKTKKQINVGSECISHFKNSGVDINLAMGLLKRVQKTVLKARKDMRLDIDKGDYDKLSIDKKRDLTLKYFMRAQAKELLFDVRIGKATLSRRQVNDILDLGLDKELKRAQDSADRIRKAKEQLARRAERHKWLMDYSGDNLFIKGLKNGLRRYSHLTEKQEKYLQIVINQEKARIIRAKKAEQYHKLAL